jgi:hypothetical protein
VNGETGETRTKWNENQNQQGENHDKGLQLVLKGRKRSVLRVIDTVPPRSTHHEGKKDRIENGEGNPSSQAAGCLESRLPGRLGKRGPTIDLVTRMRLRIGPRRPGKCLHPVEWSGLYSVCCMLYAGCCYTLLLRLLRRLPNRIESSSRLDASSFDLRLIPDAEHPLWQSSSQYDSLRLLLCRSSTRSAGQSVGSGQPQDLLERS